MTNASTSGPSETTLRLQHAFKVALSMVLLYWFALWVNWDLPKYGGLAIALISLDTTGASLRKGILRIFGTTVGLAVGLLGLAFFAQDAWLTLAFHSAYLVVVGYFMQTSRYQYAWFVAGFLPTLVWATTYGTINNAFHYAVFRYLETSAGVVIYTLVSMIFWPRGAGEELDRQGSNLWHDVHELFHLYRQEVNGEHASADAVALRTKIAGALSKFAPTIQASFADTPSVHAQQRTWEALAHHSRLFCDTLELWHQSISDCRQLDVDGFAPTAREAVDMIDRRFARLEELWKHYFSAEELAASHEDDSELMAPLAIDLDHAAGSSLTSLDRAALLSFLQQLSALDSASRQLLATMREIAGLAPTAHLKMQNVTKDLYRPAHWDTERLVVGLLPALSFVSAFFFWIYFNPPTGPSVPNMAATFALIAVMTPMKVINLLPLLLVAMWAFIAPVYLFVMPRLGTGVELLALIFAFCFGIVSLIGGRLTPLRTLVLALFTMLTGISNQQSYSFMGLVNGAQMFLLSLTIIAIVQLLLNPMGPEQTLVKTVQKFFRGCAKLAGGISPNRSESLSRRKRDFQTMIVPGPGRVLTTTKHLDFKLYPDNGPEKVQQLHDGLQNVVYRLESLELAHRSEESRQSFADFRNHIDETLQQVFKRWENLEHGEYRDNVNQLLQKLSRDVESELDRRQSSHSSDKTLTELFIVIGRIRGLIEALQDMQTIISDINWRQWFIARF